MCRKPAPSAASRLIVKSPFFIASSVIKMRSDGQKEDVFRAVE
jgi:hypothetical protein